MSEDIRKLDSEAKSALLTEEDCAELRRVAYLNPPVFLRTFLPEWFPGSIPWVHRGIIAINLRRADFLLQFDDDYGPRELQKIIDNFFWEDSNGERHYIFSLTAEGKVRMVLGRNVLIMMPRGFPKTTLLLGLITFSVCYQEKDFEMLVSATAGHSVKSLKSIANQLESNPLIKRCFGPMRPPQRSGVTWSESDGEITTLSGVSIMAKGSGSQVRGSNINAKRPKRIIVDDLEDKESVNTPEQRKKLKEWFFSDLKYALPRTYKSGQIVMLATLLHQESLPTVVWNDLDFVSVVFGAIDSDGEALWPEAMTLDEIEQDKVSMASKGLLHLHYLELHNKLVPPEDQSFKPESIIIFPRGKTQFTLKAIAMDPAISENTKADYAAITTGGVTEDGFFHVNDIWMDKGKSPDDLIDKYFEMIFDFQMTAGGKFGIESIAYQKALLHYTRQMMFKRKFWFEITPVQHGNQNKIARISGELKGRYGSGSVTHQRPFPLYQSQLLDFPNSKLDGPDAVSMLFNLLGPAVHVAGDPEGGAAAKDEYPPLDEVLGGDWRKY